MGTNLPQKYNESLFNKLKKFFRKFFSNKIDKNTQLKTDNNEKTINTKTPIEQLKENTKRSIEQEKLINQLIENPQLIKNWPIERLDKLNKICEEQIQQLEFEIATIEGKSS